MVLVLGLGLALGLGLGLALALALGLGLGLGLALAMTVRLPGFAYVGSSAHQALGAAAAEVLQRIALACESESAEDARELVALANRSRRWALDSPMGVWRN